MNFFAYSHPILFPLENPSLLSLMSTLTEISSLYSSFNSVPEQFGDALSTITTEISSSVILSDLIDSTHFTVSSTVI